ncbi:hypothetical protein P6F26_01505 [Roseibacterium sp. SDUM158017]|uniref:hypothetical protein n=1 Tax=Roseicyclus salinarum TaxID=3036773 RepID=UPI0024155512|nr:hypothetical protein [Roseibacterium sp. SDUM158017]MDG4647108.1 hypothetical protein [Roseibacterium sp. SDUM158017]
MPEHVPPRALVALMALFLGGMAACALVFWFAALVWPDGIAGLMAYLGPGPVSLFGALHVLAAVTGILLWQWRRTSLRPVARVALEAATLYFGLAVVLGLISAYMAASLLDRLI